MRALGSLVLRLVAGGTAVAGSVLLPVFEPTLCGVAVVW